MQFEQGARGRRTVTFEVDSETGFHEQIIAASALGILTSSRRKDAIDRVTTARLGVRIGRLEMTTPGEDKPAPIPSMMPLLKREAILLGTALEEFIDDTPSAIQAGLAFSGPAACNTRAVEADMAQTMLEQLTKEYSLKKLVTSHSLGFS